MNPLIRRGWRGMNMTTTGTRQLADLRRQLLDPPTLIRHKINTDVLGQPGPAGAVD